MPGFWWSMTDPSLPPPPKRKPKQPLRWQGHRVITEDDLDRVFVDDGNVEKPHIYHRRILHGIVLVLLVGLIIAAVLTATAVARGDLKIPGWGPPPAPEPVTCPAGTYDYPDNGSFRLNVYNGTQLEGLGSRVAGELADRGYDIGAVGNKTLSFFGMSAVIVSGKAGEANAFNLQRNIPDTEYVADDRTDASVDVVVGAGYKELVDANLVDQTPGTLSCPRLSPAPTEPAEAE
jgi:hypothetical protein